MFCSTSKFNRCDAIGYGAYELIGLGVISFVGWSVTWLTGERKRNWIAPLSNFCYKWHTTLARDLWAHSPFYLVMISLARVRKCFSSPEQIHPPRIRKELFPIMSSVEAILTISTLQWLRNSANLWANIVKDSRDKMVRTRGYMRLEATAQQLNCAFKRIKREESGLHVTSPLKMSRPCPSSDTRLSTWKLYS